MSLSPELKFVSVGGCYDVKNDRLIHCAALKEECEASNQIRFKSALDLQDLGDDECTTSNLPVGVCLSTGQCAITQDSCDDTSDFSRIDPENRGCNAEGIKMNNKTIPTQYGACVHGATEEIICVLTPDDCSDREAWIPAKVAEQKKRGGCRCHDVKVGVCKDGPSINPMLSTCAISADDCHPLVQTFSTARNVIDHALLDCRLCPYDENLTSDTKLTEIETPVETSNEKDISVAKKNESIVEINTDVGKKIDQSTDISNPQIFSFVMGSLIAFCVILVVLLVFFRKRKKQNSEKGTSVELEVPKGEMN